MTYELEKFITIEEIIKLVLDINRSIEGVIQVVFLVYTRLIVRTKDKKTGSRKETKTNQRMK
jgi:hypothetical protein